MKRTKKTTLASICGSAALLAATSASAEDAVAVTADKGVSFSPKPGMTAKVLVNGQGVTLTVSSGVGTTEEKITVETENENNLKVNLADYNFDGHQDFSISHLDDGMGTYHIYQIYVFSPKADKFIQLKPKCGDEFINVVVSKANRRTLTSSYMDSHEPVWKSCKMKF